MSDVPPTYQYLPLYEAGDWPPALDASHHSYHEAMLPRDPNFNFPAWGGIDPSSQPHPNGFVDHNVFSVHHQSEPPTSSASVLSTTALNGSGPLSFASQQGVPGPATGQQFECEHCHKTFDRFSRLDNCRNRHLGIKPWQCGGRCHDPSCDAKYACVDYLRRHLLSAEERCARCPKCHHNISKQNMARHKESCV